MQISQFIPAVLSILLVYSCAVRDNEYDPLSPLHKSPVISVIINDTTRSTSDTISGTAPLPLDIDVSANDFFISDKKASVTFRHYLNDSLCEVLEEFSPKIDTLKNAGKHRLAFSAKSENAAESVHEIIILIDDPIRPKIKSFFCQYDTLPRYSTIPVSFYVEFTDTDLIADHIVYGITSETPSHKITTASPSASFYDTCKFENGLYSFREFTQTFWVYLYDKTGAVDSQSTTVTYSDDTHIYIGSPPIIDSVFIVEERPAIYAKTGPWAGTEVTFSFIAEDPDGKIVDTLWDFGDKEASAIGRPTHVYNRPGTYTVKFSLLDDSANIASDSIIIEVIPKTLIPPKLLTFTVENSEGPPPLTISVTVVGDDEDGYVSSTWFTLDGYQNYDFSWPQIKNQKVIIKEQGTHFVTAYVMDEDGNKTSETKTVIVTAPKE